MNLLELRGVSVHYGGLRAVDGVDLDIAPGAFVGLIGPNGAGKTTLVDAVTGMVRCTGAITLNGERIDGLRAHRRAVRGLARTFQSLELFADLSIRENLLAVAERPTARSIVRDLVRPRPAAPAAAAVDEALELLGITAIADAAPDDVSLGHRKLVTVARALASRPALLLLDEPAAGLDSAESLVLGEKLRAVAATGAAIMLVDHDMGLVLGVCEHIHVLEFGALIASGPPDRIARDERVIAAYLGGTPSVEVAS
jgi:ABC-type branched-subunit amino acid transport system ATPase component